VLSTVQSMTMEELRDVRRAAPNDPKEQR
jgi:hypothetical protein